MLMYHNFGGRSKYVCVISHVYIVIANQRKFRQDRQEEFVKICRAL